MAVLRPWHGPPVKSSCNRVGSMASCSSWLARTAEAQRAPPVRSRGSSAGCAPVDAGTGFLLSCSLGKAPLTTGCRTAEKHPRNPPKDFKKPISLVFCMGQKTHEKTQKFSPGSGTENSIYSFGNEVRDDFFFPPGPELKTVFIALEMKFAMTESHFLSYTSRTLFPKL